MNKEFEELKKIEEHVNCYEKDKEDYKEQFELLRKALTPPTAEEVCEAIGKHYKLDDYESCLFDVNTKNIVVNRWAEKIHIVWFYKGEIRINQYLPPHLITLIGRFYEGVENNGNTK